MLLRILGEVLVGLLVAGIVMAVAGAGRRCSWATTTGPWLVWVAVAVSIAACVVDRRAAEQAPKGPPVALTVAERHSTFRGFTSFG